MRVNKCKPCGESSPYREWVDSRGLNPKGLAQERTYPLELTSRMFSEVAKGDPDILPVPEARPSDPQLEAILSVIDEGGEQVLTPKQRKAFQLIVREGRSYRETAKAMKVNINAVQDLVKAGAKKLRILCLTK